MGPSREFAPRTGDLTHTAALHDGRPEERVARRRRDDVAAVGRELERDRDGPCRLAKDGDFARVAAKSRDVLLHPLEREALVEEAGIGRDGRVCASFLAREETEAVHAAAWRVGQSRLRRR